MTDDSNREFSGAVNQQRPMMRGDGCTAGNPMSDWKTEALRRFGPIPAGAGENSRLIAAYHYAFIEGAKAALALSSTDRAAPPSVEPVAWRIMTTKSGATGYVYTEQLPFEPGPGVHVRRDPEPLYAAPPSVALEARNALIEECAQIAEKYDVIDAQYIAKRIRALTHPQPGGAVAGTERAPPERRAMEPFRCYCRNQFERSHCAYFKDGSCGRTQYAAVSRPEFGATEKIEGGQS